MTAAATPAGLTPAQLDFRLRCMEIAAGLVYLTPPSATDTATQESQTVTEMERWSIWAQNWALDQTVAAWAPPANLPVAAGPGGGSPAAPSAAALATLLAGLTPGSAGLTALQAALAALPNGGGVTVANVLGPILQALTGLSAPATSIPIAAGS